MRLTNDLLIEKNASDKTLEWFINAFTYGGDYQVVIDQAVSDDHTDYASWLVETFGTTGGVLEVSSDDSPNQERFCLCRYGYHFVDEFLS